MYRLDDEIKLAGLEALVPEERETLDTLLESLRNVRGCAPGNRDACCGEVWFEDPQDLEDNLIPWMLMRSLLFHPAKEKGHRVHEMVCFKCGGAHCHRNLCNARIGNGMQSSGNGKQNKSWSMSDGKAKERVRRARENAKEIKRFQRCERFVQG